MCLIIIVNEEFRSETNLTFISLVIKKKTKNISAPFQPNIINQFTQLNPTNVLR